jgi:hypothetical protein
MVMLVLVAVASVPEEAVSVYAPAVSRIRSLLKFATPFDAGTVGVAEGSQLPDDGVSDTDADDPVSVLPYISSMVTTAPKAVPAVPVEGGWVVKTSLVAAAGTIVTLELAALAVSPEEVAVNVSGPEVSRIRLLNVATPLTADTVAVLPDAKLPEEGASVIEAVEVASTLPLEFSTWTVTLKTVPAVTLEVGTLVTTSLSGGGEELPQQPVRKYNEYARIPTQSSAHFLCSISYLRNMKPDDERPEEGCSIHSRRQTENAQPQIGNLNDENAEKRCSTRRWMTQPE